MEKVSSPGFTFIIIVGLIVRIMVRFTVNLVPVRTDSSATIQDMNLQFLSGAPVVYGTEGEGRRVVRPVRVRMEVCAVCNTYLLRKETRNYFLSIFPVNTTL